MPTTTALPSRPTCPGTRPSAGSATSQVAAPPTPSPQPSAAPARASPPRVLLHALGWAAALAALLLTFSLYTQPDFMLKLANQLWFCA